MATKLTSQETQIKNLIKQAIKKSQLANDGELIGGEFDLSESNTAIKVRLFLPNRFFTKASAIVQHSRMGTWNAILGKGFAVGKPWQN